MISCLKTAALAALALLACSIALAHSDGIYNPTASNVGDTFGGIDSNKASNGAAYSGPGDVVSGAVYWYGLRGYNSAYAAPGTNCAVDLVDQAGANPLTCVHILSNGNLDVASINAWVTAHSVSIIKVTKIYDQTGNGNHLIQATLATMPVITLNAIGVLSGLTFSGAQRLSSGGGTSGGSVTTHAQPWSVSGAAKQNSGVVGALGATNTTITTFGGDFTNQIDLYAGTDFTTADTFGTFKIYQGVANGASSAIKINNSASVTGNANTNATGNTVLLGEDAFGNFLTGTILDLGWWPSDITSSQSALYTNEKAYWGTP